MISNRALARPYARAIFELAVQTKKLATWAEFFRVSVLMFSDERIVTYMQHPRTTIDAVYQCLVTLSKPVLFLEADNFLKLLVRNKRWSVFTTIAAIFSELQNDYEEKVVAQVRSVVPFTEQEQAALMQFLNRYLSKTVQIETEIDASLLGGFIIRVGDLVIDHSVRSSLNRLRALVLIH